MPLPQVSEETIAEPLPSTDVVIKEEILEPTLITSDSQAFNDTFVSIPLHAGADNNAKNARVRPSKSVLSNAPSSAKSWMHNLIANTIEGIYNNNEEEVDNNKDDNDINRNLSPASVDIFVDASVKQEIQSDEESCDSSSQEKNIAIYNVKKYLNKKNELQKLMKTVEVKLIDSSTSYEMKVILIISLRNIVDKFISDCKQVHHERFFIEFVIELFEEAVKLKSNLPPSLNSQLLNPLSELLLPFLKYSPKTENGSHSNGDSSQHEMYCNRIKNIVENHAQDNSEIKVAPQVDPLDVSDMQSEDVNNGSDTLIKNVHSVLGQYFPNLVQYNGTSPAKLGNIEFNVLATQLLNKSLNNIALDSNDNHARRSGPANLKDRAAKVTKSTPKNNTKRRSTTNSAMPKSRKKVIICVHVTCFFIDLTDCRLTLVMIVVIGSIDFICLTLIE